MARRSEREGEPGALHLGGRDARGHGPEHWRGHPVGLGITMTSNGTLPFADVATPPMRPRPDIGIEAGQRWKYGRAVRALHHARRDRHRGGLFVPGRNGRPRGAALRDDRPGTGRCAITVAPSRLRAPATGGPMGVSRLGFFGDRQRVAVVVTTDGRRVTIPMSELPTGHVSPDSLRSLLAGLDGLLGLLITGSRRENGGTRRDERH